jgi:hypothetical protein
VTEPLDLDGTVRTLSTSERVTACLAGAAQTPDLELRLAYLGAARQAFAKLEAQLAALKIMLAAAEDEARAIVRRRVP